MANNSIFVVEKNDSNTISDTDSTAKIEKSHKLNCEWCIWAHLPHDTEWSLKSYKNLYKFETVEKALTIYDVIPNKLVVNCMLFLMRDGIKPTWEDEKNRHGGCFSYKISNKYVVSIWKKLSYMLIGETLSNKKDVMATINGITISPKKHFCIIKLWLSTCKYQDPSIISEDCGLSREGCLFKKHKPVN